MVWRTWMVDSGIRYGTTCCLLMLIHQCRDMIAYSHVYANSYLKYLKMSKFMSRMGFTTRYVSDGKKQAWLDALCLSKYVKATANCRAKLSLIFKAVMKTYTFDATTLPERCKKSRKRQFKYMMDAMRYVLMHPMHSSIYINTTQICPQGLLIIGSHLAERCVRWCHREGVLPW